MRDSIRGFGGMARVVRFGVVVEEGSVGRAIGDLLADLDVLRAGMESVGSSIVLGGSIIFSLVLPLIELSHLLPVGAIGLEDMGPELSIGASVEVVRRQDRLPILMLIMSKRTRGMYW